MKKIIEIGIFTLLIFVCLSVFIRKPVLILDGNITALGGPFESSSSNSRFALIQSIVMDKSLVLSKSLADFAAPDVTAHEGKYFSLFTPGVSLLGVPLYILGDLWNLQQPLTYLSNLIFAILNVWMITILGRRMNVNLYLSLCAGLLFLFSTNALSYSTTLSQHHISAFFILLGFAIATGPISLFWSLVLGITAGAATLVDLPNLIFLMPLLLFYAARHIRFLQSSKKTTIQVNLRIFFVILGIIPMLLLFGWYNYSTTGSYTLIAQMIGRSPEHSTYADFIPPSAETTRINDLQKSLFNSPYRTRNQIIGYYTLLVSDERSWFLYCPVSLVGLLGIYLGFKNKHPQHSILGLTVISFIIISYALFGDPWGGWSFGPRYLIPATAMVSVFIPLTMKKFGRRLAFLIPLAILSVYGIYISTQAALTTNNIPPKQEALALSNPIPYTPQYNSDLINQNFSSSLAYELIPWSMTVRQFHVFTVFALFVFIGYIYLKGLFYGQKIR